MSNNVNPDVFEKMLEKHTAQYAASESNIKWMPPGGTYTCTLSKIQKGVYSNPQTGEDQPYFSPRVTIVDGELEHRAFGVGFFNLTQDWQLGQLKDIAQMLEPTNGKIQNSLSEAVHALERNIGTVVTVLVKVGSRFTNAFITGTLETATS